jgi:hypothetical protein
MAGLVAEQPACYYSPDSTNPVAHNVGRYRRRARHQSTALQALCPKRKANIEKDRQYSSMVTQVDVVTD